MKIHLVRVLLTLCLFLGQAQGRGNPYACEGAAQDESQNASTGEVREKARQYAINTDPVSFCTAAELYKRVGDARAQTYYENAIDADEKMNTNEPEPAFELFYGDYLRLYRGAGQRPLFPEAEKHLLRARAKLDKLYPHRKQWPPCDKNSGDWDPCTNERVQRSLTALYERDGIHLASRKTATPQSDVSHPWLFFSPAARADRSTDDFDQTSDIRDLTAAALFSQNCLPYPVGRNCQLLTQGQLAGMARVETPMVYGSISKYLGPDRLNLSYTYVRQNINPTPYLTNRDRELMGGMIDYQIFRRLFDRSLNEGLGRYFETRGIDLIAGVLDDHDHYTGPNADVIVRRDYFVGVAAKGFKRVDVTVQPTWYSSRVSIDPTQYNAQFRLAGNVLYRIVDEERTPGIPSLRFLGLPVAFIQIVVPFHYDVPHADFKAFESRSVGGELWAKVFADQKIGVTVLGVAGYSRDWFPLLNKEFNLGRVGLSIGF
jgi:hypothetical protein